jgi:hypothetical protein
MSAVVELVKDVVGGVGEAVGDVFEGAVDIVEDVGVLSMTTSLGAN